MISGLEGRITGHDVVSGRVGIGEGKIAGLVVIKWRPLWEISGVQVQDGAGIQIGELAYASANNRFVSPRRPGNSKARLRDNLLDAGQDAVRAGVGNCVEGER